MAGRIVLFGATGYTGRLTAEAMAERGMKPVLAARTKEKCDRLAEELGGGFETAAPTSPTRRRWPLGREGRRARDHRRPVRALGRSCRGRGVDRGRPLHRFDGRAAVHPRGVRPLRAGGRAAGLRDAHRARVRLGAGESRWRTRARPRRRRRRARGHRLLHHRRSLDERRHQGVAGRRRERAGVRVPGRAGADGAGGEARAAASPWARRSSRACRLGAPSTSRCHA